MDAMFWFILSILPRGVLILIIGRKIYLFNDQIVFLKKSVSQNTQLRTKS